MSVKNSKSSRIKITEAFRQKIRDNIERTGLGGQAILRGRRKEKPDDLTLSTINNVINGKIDTLTRETHDYLKTLWDDAPVWIDLEKSMVDHIRAERKRTAVGVTELLRSSSNVPDGLKVAHINSWLGNAVKKVRKHHYDFVVSAYAARPDGPSSRPKKARKYFQDVEKILLAEDYLKLIKSEFRRTGLGPTSLVRRLPPEKQYLAKKISLWTTGRLGQAPTEDVEMVIEALASLPTAKKKEKKKTLQDNRIKIPREVLEELHYHRIRTGLGGMGLMRHAVNPPKGLSGYMVQRWLDVAVKSVPKESINYLDYVLDLYKRLPTHKKHY